MSLPNLLSLSRIPLGGAFWLVLGPIARGSIWAFLVLGLAALTDVLDGYLARRQAQRAGGAVEPDGGTGAWLDPICDKLFVAAVLAAIIVRRHPALLIIALILTRELVQLPLGIAYRFIPDAAPLAALRLPREPAGQGSDGGAVPGDRRADP